MFSVSSDLRWLRKVENNLMRTEIGKVKERQSGLLEYARGVYGAALGRMPYVRDMHH
jgi:hypothetical protein